MGIERAVVVGSGVAGASVAFALARRGVQVTVVDASEPAAATLAGAGIIQPWGSSVEGPYYELYAAGADYYPTLLDQLAAAGGTDVGYRRVGAIIVSADAHALDAAEQRVRGRVAQHPIAGQVRRISPQEARSLFPPLDSALSGVWIEGAARVDGRALRAALLRASERLGARVLTGVATVALDASGHPRVRVGPGAGGDRSGGAGLDGPGVRDGPGAHDAGVHEGGAHDSGADSARARDAGTGNASADTLDASADTLDAGADSTSADTLDAGADLAADAIIVAAGAWTNSVLGPLGATVDVSPQRGQISHLRLDGVDTSTWPSVSPIGSHYLLAFDDSRVVVGATRETGAGFDARVTASGQREVLDAALATAPGLADAGLIETRVGLRPLSGDDVPHIGALPGHPRVFVATGFGAGGLTMGPVVGELLASVIADADAAATGTLAPFVPRLR